jgi:hypothetical protein
MNNYISKIRKPIKRQSAENYLLLTLLSFAASVALTRLFLELSGYPTIGSGNLHIAHVLWGGLFLFIAALLPIVFANRWVYVVNAILAGIGVGLFIDEVGKFITQTNDYFYPPAAPIIYAFFLLTVLIYLQVRRTPPRDPRSEFYHVLDALQEVLDHDLDSEELADLRNSLDFITRQDDFPQLSLLAEKISDFLAAKELIVVPNNLNFWGRYLNFATKIEAIIAEERRHRAVITGGLFALGVVSLYRVTQLLLITTTGEGGSDPLTGFDRLLTVESSVFFWFAARLILEAGVGIILLVSVYLILSRKMNKGLSWGYYGLLASLTGINLIIFYFDQFSTILPALIQFLLLMGIIAYRRKYHQNPMQEPVLS